MNSGSDPVKRVPPDEMNPPPRDTAGKTGDNERQSHASSARTRRSFLQSLTAASAGMAFGRTLMAAGDTGATPMGPVPKRKFGRHEEMISSLGIGGHTLARVASLEEATRIVHAAIEAGITFMDNAWEYMEGRGEEWMGAALKGRRDQVFLMTKVCTHREGHHTREKAMVMLEESLERLKTDRLDLWQVHAVKSEAEADAIFVPDGVIEAIEDARKQGKIRYSGFTGHSSPEALLRVLARRYPFDAVQLPLSVCDAGAGGFQKKVLPELLEQGIAPLAMKSLGGNARMIRDGLVSAGEALRYVLSLPVASLVSGIDSMEWLAHNARMAATFTPLSSAEMAALEERCAGRRQYQPYRHWAYVDGRGPAAA